MFSKAIQTNNIVMKPAHRILQETQPIEENRRLVCLHERILAEYKTETCSSVHTLSVN